MTKAIRDAVSLWDFSAPDDTSFHPLEENQRTDVAIIGGGFTGLSTALHLGMQGIASRVLESEHIGYGGSGRNFGLVNPGLWLAPETVRKAVGERYCDRFLETMADAPRYVFSIIDRYNIECEDTRTATCRRLGQIRHTRRFTEQESGNGKNRHTRVSRRTAGQTSWHHQPHGLRARTGPGSTGRWCDYKYRNQSHRADQAK